MASTSTSPSLQGMPPELLQAVAKLADPSDLLALRGVCRDLEQKLFNVWAKRTIAQRSCFVLDHAQLDVLDAIASRTALSERLQSLTLTVRRLHSYHSSDVHLAAGPGFDAHIIAQKNAMAFLLHESEEAHPGPIDGNRLAIILRRLMATTAFQLSLDLTTRIIWGRTGDADDAAPLLPRYNTAYRDVLQVIARAQCEVTKITIDDNLALDVNSIGLATLYRIMSPLREIEIIIGSVVSDHDDNHFNHVLEPRHHHAQRSMLRAAEHLQKLSIIFDSHNMVPCCDRTLQPDVRNVATMLHAAPMRRLTSLRLHDVAIPEAVFFNVLDKCAETMTCLILSGITIDTTSWRGAFRRLASTCRHLAHIMFRGLMVRRPGAIHQPLVFDIEARQQQRCELRADTYFGNRDYVSWEAYNTLEVRGLQEVQASLSSLSTADEHCEAPGPDHSAFTSESYEQWEQGGCGRPDFFGYDQLEEF